LEKLSAFLPFAGLLAVPSRCAGRFSNQTDNMDMTDNANTISRWTLEVTDEVLGHDQALTERRHQNGDALA